MTDNIYDVAIIGAGPAGYEAAFLAKSYGNRVALIEKDSLGGTCLNRGCIPTKAIMKSSHLYRECNSANVFGIEPDNTTANFDKIVERKNHVVSTLQNGILSLIKKRKIDLFEGTAKVISSGKIKISTNDSETVIDCKNILIATGSSPFVPPIPGADSDGVLTSDDLLKEGIIPMKNFTIIGGGAIGVEFATIYNDLGVNVTLIEAMDRLIPTMDKELGQSLKLNLKKRGIDVKTGVLVKEINSEAGGLLCTFEEKGVRSHIKADKILICTGRKPNTNNLFPEELSSKILDKRGFLIVNENYETEITGIYGAGDVTGGILLAHAGSAEARNAISVINGKKPGIDMHTVPGCIYSNPEIASVGLSEKEAKDAGISVITKKFPMSANGRTLIDDLDRGFIKITARESDKVIIGAVLMCGRATDIVSELALAISNKLTIDDIAKTIHPHPTFSEAIWEAAKN